MMNISCRNALRAAGLILALLVGIAACGIKGPPVPPEKTPPAPVGDLRAVVDGNQIHLTWTLGAAAAGEKSALEGFHVFQWRQAIDDPACPGCPKVYERIALIGMETGVPEAPERLRFSHDAALQSGYRYSLKVIVFSRDGLVSKDSNLLEFDY